MIIIAFHIIEDTNAIGLAYTHPRNNLCDFFKGTRTTRQRNVHFTESDHLIFTLGHRIDNMKLRDILFRNFTVYKELRHHANDFAACVHHGSRYYTHEPRIPTTINERVVVFCHPLP